MVNEYPEIVPGFNLLNRVLVSATRVLTVKGSDSSVAFQSPQSGLGICNVTELFTSIRETYRFNPLNRVLVSATRCRFVKGFERFKEFQSPQSGLGVCNRKEDAKCVFFMKVSIPSIGSWCLQQDTTPSSGLSALVSIPSIGSWCLQRTDKAHNQRAQR